MAENLMRAAVYRGVDDVRVEQVPIPEPGPGEMLVQVQACGVCGTDIKKIQFGLVPPPRIFGHETAGTVAAVGAGVAPWREGDRVVVHHHIPCMQCHYCRHADYAQCPVYKRTGTTAGFEPAGGGFAEYVLARDWVVERGTVRIPDGVSPEEATFVEPANTVLKAVLKSDLGPGDTALVIGQGPIGLLFTRLLCWRGATVVASEPLPYRREAALRCGAAAVLTPGADDIGACMRERTDGRGADLAVLAVSVLAAVAPAFESVRPGGAVMVFANTRLGDPVTVDAGAVCMLEKDLLGSYSSDVTLQDQSADLVFSRTLDVRDWITHRFPLEDIGTALRTAVSPAGGSLKVVVNP